MKRIPSVSLTLGHERQVIFDYLQGVLHSSVALHDVLQRWDAIDRPRRSTKGFISFHRNSSYAEREHLSFIYAVFVSSFLFVLNLIEFFIFIF